MQPVQGPDTFDHADLEAKGNKARRRLYAVWTWVGAILLTAVGVYLANILSIPIGIVIWTVVIVFMLGGVVNYLEQHADVNRLLGTTFAYLLLFGALLLLGFFIFSPDVGISAQFRELAESVPGYIDNLVAWGNELYERYSDILQSEEVRQWITSAVSSLGDFARNFATMSASGVVAAGTSIANVLITIGFALIVAFWMLIDLPNLKKEAKRLVTPEHAEEAHMFYLTFTRVMGGYIKATFLQCTIIGLGCGVLYAILGLASPAALGTLTGLLNIIPIVGPWMGGALACLSNVFTDPVMALVALIGTIIIQQAVYTFLSPRIMGDSVDIHPAVTFIALMAGSSIGTAMGGLMGALVGALLSIPVVAVAKSVFVYYFERNTGRRVVSEDGVFFKGVTSDDTAVDPMADATAMAPAAPVQPPHILLKESQEASSAEENAGEKR